MTAPEVPRPRTVRPGAIPRRRTIVGRAAQLDALDAARAAAATGGRFALVRGPAGSGRTSLLDAAAGAWRTAGVVVLRVAPAAPGDTAAGFAALLNAVRDQYELLADPPLAGPLSALGALCDKPAGEHAGRGIALAQQAAAAFALIGRRAPTVLIADDAGPALAPALAAAVRAGCLVVAAGAPGDGRLGTLADVVVDLPPLSAEAVRAMLARRYAVPVDDAVPAALSTALGPLAGHPGTVLEIAHELTRAGRLAVVRGHLCLLDPHAPIALPTDHSLLAALRARGPVAVRLATMAAVTRFGIDDLPLFADATRGRLSDYGWMIDELIDDGLLVAGPQGGILPQSPALTARLITDAGPDAVARLHRACAAAMFRRAASGRPADGAALADQVTSAGVALPFDRRTAVTLAATADENTDRAPDRAAHWLRAALWHSGGGRAGDDILARLLRLLVRTGQVVRLGEVVDTAIQRGHGASSRHAADLAAAAVLVAVHTGVPVSATIRSALRGAPVASATVAFADWWRTGVPPAAPMPPAAHADTGSLLHPAELGVLAGAVGPGLADAGPATEELLLAGERGDLAALLGLVLGPHRYGVPKDGLLSAYHRLHTCQAGGDLSGLLSAARELDLTGAEAPLPRCLARLWAAEALGLLGRATEAPSWLRSVPAEPPYAALRWWAANGPAGEVQTAQEAARRLGDGRRAYESHRHHGSRIGVEHLLVRAAGLAARFGLGEQMAWLTAAVDADATEPRRRLSRQTTLLVQALCRGDASAAERGVDLVRAGGNRLALAYACLALGRVAEDPRPWLVEAQAVAKTMTSGWLRSAVAAAMRERDVRQPRTRTPRTGFSPVETHIIELIGHGRTNRQIAAQVRISEKTVENHLTRLFARTGCRSRVELAAVSLTTDILGPAS
ncbi:LuxR C-terminal-related transcriptional regulator [Micromonospora sp. NPDC049101]|uniref:LuxR C-terminal-related transcriptional regulator n=1 Tax=Micromonospora sp. NPDC049101 TaxID=3155032 RepID=UPI00340CD625